jgi:succinyl-CoA synthetase beta subunit
MDLVKYYGGEPAHFSRHRGQLESEKVVNALRIITADRASRRSFQYLRRHNPHRRRGNGIVTATAQFKVELPIVIRLTGTNEAEAFRILRAWACGR